MNVSKSEIMNGKREILHIMSSHINIAKQPSAMNTYSKIAPDDMFQQLPKAFF